MHHIALDWSWSNNGDFNHDIIKTLRLHPRQGGHLGPALDLKNSDRVRLLHDFEGGGIVFWDVSEIERTTTIPTQLQRILHDRHHAEAEQIYFYDPQIFAIILVPLGHDPAGHGCVLQWHERTKFVLAD